jgi:pyruvate dehydrogenase E2 component (dihydrolipoamide acetyltransferase)
LTRWLESSSSLVEPALEKEMSIEVRLPQLAAEMTSVKVVGWLKKEGDAVVVGEVIAELETDKTNVELEAPGSGVLQKIHITAGGDAAVGELLALIAVIDDPLDQAVETPTPSEAVLPRNLQPAVLAQAIESPVEVAATPLAARMAGLAGIDLSSIRSSVIGGRITKTDVENVLKKSLFEDQPMSAMRRVTAERLQRAKQTIPHFYLQSDCSVDALLSLRA